jgi:hypothetical protein
MRLRETILSVGADPELVSLRHAVLLSVGLDVFSTIDPEEAYVRIQPANLALMLVCYSLAQPVRQRLAKRFRDCCPTGRIISITNEKVEESHVYGDRVFYGIEGAEALIDAVRAALAGA